MGFIFIFGSPPFSVYFVYFNDRNAGTEARQWMWHLEKQDQPRTPGTIACMQPFTLPMIKTSLGTLSRYPRNRTHQSSSIINAKFSFLKYGEFYVILWLTIQMCIIQSFSFSFFLTTWVFAISQIICTSTNFSTFITVSDKRFGERGSWCKWEF